MPSSDHASQRAQASIAAGLVIGPFGIGLFTDPAAILRVAELGVVMLLFIIGLEMKPSRLWSLRREIFGLGVTQVLTCGVLLTLVGILAGYDASASFVAGMGFVLTSTAVVLQVLEERGETNEPQGQKIVSILLLEDAVEVLRPDLAQPDQRAAEAQVLAGGGGEDGLAAAEEQLRLLLGPFQDQHAGAPAEIEESEQVGDLEALEAHARTRGLGLVRLETGIHQHEAIGLYRRHGYVACVPFVIQALAPLRTYVSPFFSQVVTRPAASEP